MTRKLFVAVLLVAACGKDGSSGGASAAAVSLTQADADAVNALVPADLKDKVTFEVAKIEDKMGRRTTTYTVVAPKGWKKGFMPGSLEPADADNFGSKTYGKTTFKVGSNCDGECKPKDWAAVTDKVYFSQFTGGKIEGKVIKDDKQKTSRTLVFEQDKAASTGEKSTQVLLAWWAEGARKHYICDVELGAPSMGLAAAFEKACSKVGVSGDD